MNKMHLVRTNVRLFCTWVPTGDARNPLICIWTPANSAQADSALPFQSSRSATMGSTAMARRAGR